ncbi:unnamed protein product [Staurois parvus]|uniref:Uncharacterized protein n=1 Tax=Staurois parvus TaxID=386267 RepID=A0ABN9GJP7_9NEOB|nr:unnamed protein product [Staurois parvus]
MMREWMSCLVVSGVRNVWILAMLRRRSLHEFVKDWTLGWKDRLESRMTPSTLACWAGFDGGVIGRDGEVNGGVGSGLGGEDKKLGFGRVQFKEVERHPI